MQDFGYYKSIVENLERVNATQGENIAAAAKLMCQAIAEDRLIHVYGGGGHTTLPVGEMFFRAGGLSCINPVMETGLSVFNQIATIMMSGILVALIFPMVIMPILGVDKAKWIVMMSALSIVTLPLILLEYYFTKERVTEETQNDSEEKKIPFLTQLKIVFTDKYFLIVIAYFLIYTFGSTMKNLGLVYYCNWVLGTYNDGITQMLVSVIGGVPMGIGIFAVWPLAKKFGKRNVTMWGFVLYAIGSLVCWLVPNNLVVVLVGQFIKNIGGLPCAYVFMALFADTLDHLEWKSGIRCDGVAMSVYNVIA